VVAPPPARGSAGIGSRSAGVGPAVDRGDPARRRHLEGTGSARAGAVGGARAGWVAPLHPGRRPASLAPPPGVEQNLTPTGDVAPPAASAPTLSTGFQGLPDNDLVIPPDTMGAVGPAHVMTMLNSQVRIQSKLGGAISTVSLDTFWTSGTGLSGNPFDPKLVYDSLSGRWIATIDANRRLSTSQVWLAVSASSDPTGSVDAAPPRKANRSACGVPRRERVLDCGGASRRSWGAPRRERILDCGGASRRSCGAAQREALLAPVEVTSRAASVVRSGNRLGARRRLDDADSGARVAKQGTGDRLGITGGKPRACDGILASIRACDAVRRASGHRLGASPARNIDSSLLSPWHGFRTTQDTTHAIRRRVASHVGKPRRGEWG